MSSSQWFYSQGKSSKSLKKKFFEKKKKISSLFDFKVPKICSSQ